MDGAIPINALFAADGHSPNPGSDPRPALHAAELIIGVDVMSRHQFLVYGRRALEKATRSGKARALRTLRIELDQSTNDLERLCALVQVVKGRCDYPNQSA